MIRILVIITIFCTTTTTVAQNIVTFFSRIDLLFAGDLMQHESQLNAARTGDGRYSYSPCYDHIRDEVSDADIAIANLETTIGSRRYGGYPSFCAPDSFLYAAKDAGFDILLFANNHCLDRGKQGALRTMQMMDSLGITHCGVYRDSTDRKERYPLIIEKNRFRIAILNYTYGTNGIPVPEPLIVNLIDEETIARDIERAKTMKPDAIIACMHWGDEYVNIPPARIKKLSNRLIEMGVDHIIGNHPHVVQPIEVRSDSVVAGKKAVIYSLGNLVSGMYARGRDGGIIVRMNINKIGDISYLDSVKYAFTWVARPERDGVDNFTILPAATATPEREVTKSKMKQFLNDSRELFRKHNKGAVHEYLLRNAKQRTVTP